jgi:hypothetical protein
VEDDLGAFDAAGLEARQEAGGEMEAGGGSRHAASLTGEDGLVAVAVVLAVGPPDVGRKGHVARSLQGFVHRSAKGPEADETTPILEGRGIEDLDLEVGSDRDHRPRAKALAGTQEGLPVVSGEGANEQDLRGLAAGPLAEKTRGEDAAPVHHHEVARGQEVGQVAKGVVTAFARTPVENEKPRGVALGQGLLRDGRPGQRVVEVFYAHSRCGRRTGRPAGR